MSTWTRIATATCSSGLQRHLLWQGHPTLDVILSFIAQARDGNRDAPVIVYLMGGPGAPSDAMMVKGIGPREVCPMYVLLQSRRVH